MEGGRERWKEKRDTDGRRIAIRYVGDVGDVHKPSVPRPMSLSTHPLQHLHLHLLHLILSSLS
jgi:hypothetical protein